MEFRKPLVFGLFRAVSGFFSVNGGDGDGGDEGRVAVHVSVAFRQGAHGGQVVFLELVGQQAEPPAQDHHVGGGKRQRKFLRRRVLIVLGIRVGFERIFDQLAGVKATSLVVREVELDAGAKLAGGGVTGILVEAGHGRLHERASPIIMTFCS